MLIPQPQLAFVERIDLWFSFAAEDAVESITFSALQAIVDSPQFSQLVLLYSDDPKCSNEHETLKMILCSVLGRKQLTWALESHKLQFWGPGKGEIITSSDILSVPTEYTLNDAAIHLDIVQQAEWLLCFTPDQREDYLRDLVTAQTDRGSSSHVDHGTCSPSCSSLGPLCSVFGPAFSPLATMYSHLRSLSLYSSSQTDLVLLVRSCLRLENVLPLLRFILVSWSMGFGFVICSCLVLCISWYWYRNGS